ncbi:hypothetical protein [Nostoc sp. CALU 1950]|uniref:hypothetical protein n=1 Tax=Nostoc sp. CALU 1950 TaxID=3104321 RepID=UPI003EBA77DE
MALELTPNKPHKPPHPLIVNGISVIWAGVWSSTKTYYKNQAVFHEGSSYRATDTTTQEPSTESTEWDVLAQGAADIGSTVDKDIYFSYSDVSSRLIYTTGTNEIILTVTVVILTPFNGTNPSISIGDSTVNDRLANNTQIYLSEVGEYATNPTYKYTSATPINLYLTAGAGATQGNGYILIESK